MLFASVAITFIITMGLSSIGLMGTSSGKKAGKTPPVKKDSPKKKESQRDPYQRRRYETETQTSVLSKDRETPSGV